MSDLHLNSRPISARGWKSGETILEFLTRRVPSRTVDYWREALDAGQVSSKGIRVNASDLMRSSDELVHTLWEEPEPPVNRNLRVIHEDESIWVISKPAPLPMHPCGRYKLNTLSEIAKQAWPHLNLHIVHRLDSQTSGVVVLAKTKEAAQHLTKQFTNRIVKKRYLAWVKGVPEWDDLICEALVKSIKHPQGQTACTELKRLGRLIEAIPITGRTNQIRQHLAGLGHPVEYLHAERLEFRHPTKETWCEFNDHWPEAYPQL